MTTPMFSRLAVIGLGLIGGSLALACKRAGLVAEVVGCARHQASLDRGLALGVIDRGELSPAAAVAGADLVFLSVPVAAMPAVMAAIAPVVGPDTLITDGGSVKTIIWQAAKSILPFPGNFIPGHPIAGRERSGVDAATADLYLDHRVILTPVESNHADAVERITRLWQRVGAKVETLSLEEHDRILAETSHLPHLLAFALVDTLSRQGDSHEVFRYAAGGFRDFTRIASSSPIMWRDIFLNNIDGVTAALDAFEQGLSHFRQAIEQQNGDQLIMMMERANHARAEFLSLAQSSDHLPLDAKEVKRES